MRFKATLFLVLLSSLVIPNLVFSATVEFGQDYSLVKGENLEGDLYTASANTTIAGSVSGDVFALGLVNIFAGDTIGENAFFVGGTVNSLAQVFGDLRIVAGSALVGGKIEKDMAVAVKELKTHPDSIVFGNVLVAGGKVFLDGLIKGETNVLGGDVYLNGEFEGPIDVSANQIIVGPNAILKNGIAYTSSAPITISEGASISGEVLFREITTRPNTEKFVPTFWGTWFLIKFLILLLGALVLHGIFRRISDKFVFTGITNFWKSLLWGFLFLIAVPAITALVALTFVGIPFTVLGISIYISLLVIAFFYSPIFVGSLANKILNNEKKDVVTWKTIVAGATILTLLDYIPIAGPLIKSLFFLVALGAIIKVLLYKFSEVR